MTWFVEERTPTGRWSPRLYHGEAPSSTTPDGKRRFRDVPVKVIPALTRYPVEVIRMILSPDGRYHGQIEQHEWAQFLAAPSSTTLILKDAA